MLDSGQAVLLLYGVMLDSNGQDAAFQRKQE